MIFRSISYKICCIFAPLEKKKCNWKDIFRAVIDFINYVVRTLLKHQTERYGKQKNFNCR